MSNPMDVIPDNWETCPLDELRNIALGDYERPVREKAIWLIEGRLWRVGVKDVRHMLNDDALGVIDPREHSRYENGVYIPPEAGIAWSMKKLELKRTIGPAAVAVDALRELYVSIDAGEKMDDDHFSFAGFGRLALGALYRARDKMGVKS